MNKPDVFWKLPLLIVTVTKYNVSLSNCEIFYTVGRVSRSRAVALMNIIISRMAPYTPAEIKARLIGNNVPLRYFIL